jgi:hypothetical protein
MLNYESNYLQVVFTYLPSFLIGGVFLPEFRIAGVLSKIRTFQIVAHKLKRLTLFDF